MKKNKLFWILTVVWGAEIHGFDFGRAAVCDVDFV